MADDLVGKTVTAGSRNQTMNQDMKPSTIDLPIKPYSFEPAKPGVRDTLLDHGGQAPVHGHTK